MPSGKTHTLINLTATTACAVFLFKTTSLPQSLILTGTAGAVFGTLFLSPDNDIRSSPVRNWGVFSYLWLPYRKIFRHRGLSHSFWFGSLTRIAYLMFLVMIGILLFNFVRVYFGFIEPTVISDTAMSHLDLLRSLAMDNIYSYWRFYLAMALGLLANDGLHILADRIF